VPIKGAILFAAIVSSLPACLVRPFYGILVWMVLAFVSPQSSLFYWSAALSFPWALAVAIPTMAGMLMFSGGWNNRLASREVLLMVALWVWFTITSTATSNTSLFVPHAAETWNGWSLVSKILLMTVVTVAIVDSLQRLRILLIVIGGCYGIVVLKALPFMILTGGAFRLYGPEHSMIADNNDLGLALNMTLPLYLFLAQSETNRWVRRLFGFLFIITIPAIFLTYSRGALIGLIAVLGLIFLQLKQRLLLVPIIVLGAIIATLFAPEAWKERMDPTRENIIDSSARGRLNAWSFSWRLALDFPITGGGFNTFTPELFARYAPNVADVHGPHSVYFQVLGEHGFVGLFLYVSLLCSCFASLRRLVKRARFHGDQLIGNYANMFRFSLVGFLTSGLFLGRAYFDYFFTIVACIAILRRLSRLQWAGIVSADVSTQKVAA
jgi:putative inorganic carbon (hco3(-)) transporter